MRFQIFLDAAGDSADSAGNAAREGSEHADDGEGDDTQHDGVLGHGLTLLALACPPEQVTTLGERHVHSCHLPRAVARNFGCCALLDLNSGKTGARAIPRWRIHVGVHSVEEDEEMAAHATIAGATPMWPRPETTRPSSASGAARTPGRAHLAPAGPTVRTTVGRRQNSQPILSI